MDNQQKALAKMNKVLMQWSFDDVCLLGSWCIIDKREDKSQKTMGINTRSLPPYITYNPNFVCALSDEYLEAVMAKEGFKILLRHCTTRMRDPKNVSNMASDVTINGHIMGGISDFDDAGTFFTAEQFGLETNKFYEEYYRRIKDMMDQIMEKVKQALEKGGAYQQQQGGQSGEGQPQDGQGSGQDGSDSQSDGSGGGQPGNQKGDKEGNDKEDGKDSDGFQEFDSQKEALSTHNDPKNSTSNDGWGENNLFDADVKQFVDSEQKNIKSWGKHSGGMLSAVIAANTPEINPKDIVRRFNNSVITQVSSSSRMKLNRRFDLESPGKRRTYKARILFGVDTSRSMSDHDLARGGALVNSVLHHAEVDYVDFDTKVYTVVKNLKKAQSEFKFEGRGGTNFQELIDYVQEHKYDGLVIFSDGCAPAPTRPSKTKVLWLLTNPNEKPPVEWGFQCHLPLEEK